jgi:fermentation-respiration switch protein FrsA (DUF1100 family)
MYKLTLSIFVLLSAQRALAADAVVAADGSGNYRTVQGAINAVPQTTTAEHRWVIFVKAGTYREIVYVQREKRFVSLVGENPLRTVTVITMRDPFVHKGSRENLLGKSPSAALIDAFSAELHVTDKTPPVFLAHSEEDATVPVENSIAFYQALRNAKVPAELHLYAKGPHGFALADGLGPTSEWPKRLEEWIKTHGWLEK